MNKKYTISWFIFFFFAVVGLFFSANLLHELSHQRDFKDYAFNESICLLNYPLIEGSVASYTYSYNVTNNETIKDIKLYTESKAWFWNILLVLIFGISMYYIIKSKK